MLDVFQSVTAGAVSAGDVVETGTVIEYLGNGKYRVALRGKEKIIQSTVKAPIAIGNYVVVNSTRSGQYIVGATGQLKSRIIKEVIVDG